jgi:hypothetical protein
MGARRYCGGAGSFPGRPARLDPFTMQNAVPVGLDQVLYLFLSVAAFGGACSSFDPSGGNNGFPSIPVGNALRPYVRFGAMAKPESLIELLGANAARTRGAVAARKRPPVPPPQHR